MQCVEIELDPVETIVAEGGAMNYVEDSIEFEARMGNGSEYTLVYFPAIGAGKRMLMGESIFMTHLTNHAGQRRVAFAAPYPGKIIPIEMDKIGGTLICQKDAFLCAALGTKVEIAFHKRLGAGLFGGEGFILEKLQGDGMAFIHAGGTVVKKQLDGNSLRVDTGCIVAFTNGIDYDIQRAGNLNRCFLAAKDCFWPRCGEPEPCYCRVCRSRGSRHASSRPPLGLGPAARAKVRFSDSLATCSVIRNPR